MTHIEKEYIVLRPAENSPWGKFLYATIKLDTEHGKPNGWHWLWAIHRLEDKFPNIDFAKLAQGVYDHDKGRHATLLDISIETDYFYATLQNLLNELGEPDEISKIDFSKLNFTGHSIFLNFTFPVEVTFTGTTFSNNTSFNYAKFFKHADFTNTKNFDTVTFKNVTFCTADFSNTSFSKNASYYGANFSGKANFNNAIFSNGAHFHETEFSDDAIFTGTKFYKSQLLTSFHKAAFSKIVNFSNAEFQGKTYFLETTFSKNAIFNNVEFSQHVGFQKATFSERAIFKAASFLKGVDFTDVTFSNIANFKNAVFSNFTNFTNSKFFGNASFEDTSFNNKIIFDIANIKKPIDFTNTHFKIYAPSFYDAKICPDMVWDNAKWPNPAQFKYAKHFKKIQYNKNSYEELGNHMEKLDKYHDKHFFFRQEMRCRRRLGKNMFIRFPYAVYEWLADYGYGAGRAILYWVVHILGGAGVLSGIRYFNLPSVSLDDFGCSVGISLSNSHAFFFKGSHLKHCYKSFEYLPWFNFIWGFQTIMGTILIFLVLLTLRIRFKL